MRWRQCLLLSTLAVLCLGCKQSERRETAAEKKTLFRDTVVCMSYNVENLFDLVDNGNEYPEFRPGRCNWTQETFARKVGNIAAAIAAANPDVLVLCEVENRSALLQLRAALSRMHRKYPYVAFGDTPNPTSTSPALLSRLPIIAERTHGIRKLEEFYTRNILETDIAMGPCTLKVFATHWPSKHNPESHRLAVAEVLRQRLAQLPPNADYLVAGDFNTDFDECETIGRKKYNDTGGKTGLNHVLRTVVSTPGAAVRYVSEAMLAANPDSLYLYDLWLELPPYKRLSYVQRKASSTLDHILIPASLYDSDGVSYVDNSFCVFRWSGRLLYDGKPWRWQMRYDKRGKRHVGEGYSDHLPLVVKLRLGPFEPSTDAE